MAGQVHALGSINQDIVVTTGRHPCTGETLAGDTLAHFPGGKGANQAVAAARAGADTRMIGLVGDDAAGRDLVAFLAEAGVNVDAVGTTGAAPTGTAIITVAGGDNTIVVVAGANGLLGPYSLASVEFGAGDVVLAQYETPREATVAAFRQASASGATTLLNPAPAGEVSPELLALTDVLVVNEHEYELIFDRPVQVVLDTDADWEKVAPGFRGTLVVTLGSDGAVMMSESDRHREMGLPADAVDSTGAGDCFVGYLAAGLSVAADFREAVREANEAAAISVTRAGAATSIPIRCDVL